MTNESKLILLTDIIESKVRKEKELEYYEKELQKLQEKMFFIRKEIDLTNLIIDIIQKDNVIDIKEQLINNNKNLLE
ncbi:hypothetical protein EB155_09055 [archaeon]|nr:hypothetical protein [archaeon]NDB80002.1 hypothetical protein [archaeon]